MYDFTLTSADAAATSTLPLCPLMPNQPLQRRAQQQPKVTAVCTKNEPMISTTICHTIATRTLTCHQPTGVAAPVCMAFLQLRAFVANPLPIDEGYAHPKEPAWPVIVLALVISTSH
eukprot:GHRR01009979.1.p1 GENE.GHRR01009979.1~~GHRR01009979.1.p1  ORF type:complete len:117 (+),score=6.23 GHRR01009979.1:934-1284(+)